MPGHTPGATDPIPLGLDDEELMPCGCQYKHALFEQWAAGVGAYTAVVGGGSRIAVSYTRSQRRYRLIYCRPWVGKNGR